jgi:hypothetical protein
VLATDNILPANADAERAILGAVLMDNALLNQAAGSLSASDFSLDAHRRIYGRMQQMSQAAIAIDSVTLLDQLSRNKELQVVGGAAYVSSLLDGLPRRTNIEPWIGIVREQAGKREAAHAAEALLHAASNGSSTKDLAARFAEVSQQLVRFESVRNFDCLTRVSDVEAQAVDWLWKGRIAKGTLTVFDGDPGQGKGLAVVDLAARVTTGRDMPDGTIGAAGRVLYLTSEDAISFVVRPRLDVARANTEHVYMLRPEAEEVITLPDNCDRLEQMVRALEVALVVIDPLSAFLGESINSHKDSDIRRALGPLHQLAESTGAAVIGVRHLNKAYGGSAMYRGGGSIAIIAASRSAFIFGADPHAEEGDDVRVMACTKLNVAEMPRAMSYRIETALHPTLVDAEGNATQIARIKWLGESDTRADELVQVTDSEQQSQVSVACDVIAKLFGDRSEVPSAEGDRAMKSAAISVGTASRARRKLGVSTRPESSGGRWVWYLTRPRAGEK